MIFCCRKKLILGTILAISIANLDVINCCSGGKKSTTNGPNPTTVNPDNKEPDGIGDSGKELVLSITIWGSKIMVISNCNKKFYRYFLFIPYKESLVQNSTAMTTRNATH